MDAVVKVAHSEQQTLSTDMKIGGALTQQPVLHVFVMVVIGFAGAGDLSLARARAYFVGLLSTVYCRVALIFVGG